MRVCACVVLVSMITTSAAAQDPGQSATSVQEFLRTGGEHWSAPAKARSIFGSVAGGDRFWIWPTDDRVLGLRRYTLAMTPAWRLNRQQRPIDQTEAQNLRLRFYSATGNFFTGGSASTFAKELHGIESGAAGVDRRNERRRAECRDGATRQRNGDRLPGLGGSASLKASCGTSFEDSLTRRAHTERIPPADSRRCALRHRLARTIVTGSKTAETGSRL